MKKYDIVTVGDASEDIFIRSSKVSSAKDRRYTSGLSATFELGEKLPIEEVMYDVGGSACNTAVAFARQGYKSAAKVACGEDFPADKIISRLEEEGVSTDLIEQRSDQDSNFSVIMRLKEDRTIFVYRGLSDYSLLAPPTSLNTRWFYLGPLGDHAGAVFKKVVEFVANKDVKVAWNPGHVQIDEKAQSHKAMLQNTEILFLNKSEGLKFVNFPISSQPKEILKKLHMYGPRTVVLTEGEKGAYCYDGKTYYKIGVLEREKKDATGAGDSFASGFVGGFLADEELEDDEKIHKALKYGVANSTSVIGQVGGQKGLLSKTEMDEVIEQHPRLVVEKL